jgi:hypothetical protein
MEQFLKECLDYCEARGLKHSTFSTYAAGDGKFLQRIEDGGQCLPSTMERVRSYMAANPATAIEPQAGAA